MTYEAIVTRIKTSPHPNADKIQLGHCLGYQVIVSLNTKDNELGVFFPSDGKLSNKFLEVNNLLKPKGFFDSNGRVRVQRFRGQKSEGFWCPLSYFNFDNISTSLFYEGMKFTELDGVKICEKYFTPKTRRSGEKNQTKNKQRKEIIEFPKHYDTKQLRYNLDEFKTGDTVYVTEKLHGTSGRTGKVKVKYYPWYKWLFKSFLKPNEKIIEISGTRNCIVNSNANGERSRKYRVQIHNKLINKCKDGEILYYEIVGYMENNKPIMPNHKYNKIKDKDIKKLQKLYGEEMEYSYGCKIGECDLYIYRITQNEKDLSFEEVLNRCIELNEKCVPVIDVFKIENREQFLLKIEHYSQGSSTIGKNHIREGVCVKKNDGLAYKYKGYWFCELEDISKMNDEYVDPEEVS